MKCLTCGFFASDSCFTNCPLCQTVSAEALWPARQAARPLTFPLLNLFGWLGALFLMFRSE